ncbi:MAG: S41 family peptidase [Rectinemataceae bacterium]
MKLPSRGSGRPAAVWGIIAVLAFVVAAFSVSVPEARAQAAVRPADDAKRYSQLLQSIYQFLLSNYVDEPDPRKLYEGAMKGMLDSLGDPHSVFLDEPMLSDMMEETEGSYAGVGLYISKQPGSAEENGPRYIEAVSPIEGSPAWKVGIHPGDLIIAIDGADTSAMTVDEASSHIRGAEGTKVTLRFRRGTNYEYEEEFIRASIEIPAVKHALIERGGIKIGYVRIIEWIPQTTDRVEEALKDLSARGADRLIVDVRSNPGGLLSSVVEVSDLFLDSGTIVSTRGRDSRDDEIFTADSKLSWPKEGRMIVLVNRGSASASEIFAGAMKDSRRALLLGEKTYGKGSVQQVFPLDTTGFKLTLARYYTPSDVNIDKTGIEPDIVSKDVDFTDAMLDTLGRLVDSGKIESWAKANPDAGTDKRNAFASSLIAAGFDLPESYLRRMVRDELDRTKIIPVYDAEFDIQMDKAIELLVGTDFESLLAEAKTLGERAAAGAAAGGDAAKSVSGAAVAAGSGNPPGNVAAP